MHKAGTCEITVLSSSSRAASLLAELRLNLDVRRGISGPDPALCAQALERLEAAAGPVTITLPGHVLRIENSQPGRAS